MRMAQSKRCFLQRENLSVNLHQLPVQKNQLVNESSQITDASSQKSYSRHNSVTSIQCRWWRLNWKVRIDTIEQSTK